MSQTDKHSENGFPRLIKRKVRMLLWSVDMIHLKGYMVEDSLQYLLLGTFPYTHWTHTHDHSPSWLPQSQSGPRTTLTPWKIPLRMIRGRFCLGAKLTLR